MENMHTDVRVCRVKTRPLNPQTIALIIRLSCFEVVSPYCLLYSFCDVGLENWYWINLQSVD